MKHYVLTRSAYGPEWTLAANRRRLDITRAVTARLMARQTFREWTWIVLLDPRDRLLDERRAVFESAAPAFIPLMWEPGELRKVPWDPAPKARASARSLVAATAYTAPWRDTMEAGVPLLQTRLDDDDGLRPDALYRYQHASAKLRGRTILMLPMGLRVYGSRYAVINHGKNAMQTLATPPDDPLCVYDYGHTHAAKTARVRIVDHQLGWVWIRHRDTISMWRNTDHPITDSVRRLFPIDWPVVEAAA